MIKRIVLSLLVKGDHETMKPEKVKTFSILWILCILLLALMITLIGCGSSSSTDTTSYTLTTKIADLPCPCTISLDPPGGVYTSGTTVTLTPHISGSWIFGYWTGDLTGNLNPGTIKMDGNKTVAAYFGS